jgi:DNA-binding transcriptional LysR family regulator
MSFDGRLLSGIGVMAAVVESGAFSRAGEAIGLSQSGVSRSVARLEERIGVRLFHRTARAVSLTEEGRQFFEDVRPLLAGIEDAASLAAGAASLVRGRLRVNSDAGFGQFVLAPNLHKLLSIYPELEVELAIRERPGDLVADGFDLAIRFGEPESSSLIGRKILETRVLTCAAPSYLDRAGTPKHPRELANHECIQYREPLTHRHYRWVLQGPKGEIEVATRGRLTVTDAGALLAACVAGHGIAQPLELHARPHLEAGRLVQLLPRWAKERFPLFLYLPTRKLPSAKTRAFLDFALSLSRRSALTGALPMTAAG